MSAFFDEVYPNCTKCGKTNDKPILDLNGIRYIQWSFCFDCRFHEFIRPKKDYGGTTDWRLDD